ncbi:uncharacterized protein ISCGN_009457 [Ixodes scapularis]
MCIFPAALVAFVFFLINLTGVGEDPQDGNRRGESARTDRTASEDPTPASHADQNRSVAPTAAAVLDDLWEDVDDQLTQDASSSPVIEQWVTVTDGHLPRSAVAAGFDNGSLLYAGRAEHQSFWTPCLVVRGPRPSCLVSVGEAMVSRMHFQYLLETDGLLFSWTTAGRGSAVPDNAVRADQRGGQLVFGRIPGAHLDKPSPVGLLNPFRRMLYGPDSGAPRTVPAFEVLSKLPDLYPNERWLLTSTGMSPLWALEAVPRQRRKSLVVGRTAIRGRLLPCSADDRGCHVIDPEKQSGRCQLALTYEYLALSRGIRYRWQQLRAHGPLPSTYVVIGHTVHGLRLSVGRRTTGNGTVLGLVVFSRATRVLPKMMSCDVDRRIVVFERSFQILVKLPSNAV